MIASMSILHLGKEKETTLVLNKAVKIVTGLVIVRRVAQSVAWTPTMTRELIDIPARTHNNDMWVSLAWTTKVHQGHTKEFKIHSRVKGEGNRTIMSRIGTLSSQSANRIARHQPADKAITARIVTRGQQLSANNTIMSISLRRTKSINRQALNSRNHSSH